jgi:intracellular multiplication protein IcmL
MNTDFYRKHYHHVILGLMGLILLMLLSLFFAFYQLVNRPLPQFHAVTPEGKTMFLIPNDAPNLLPDTILRWASKAATAAYTFNFVNYQQQTAAVKSYFTEDGWQDYLTSVNKLISSIVANKLFVNGVVSGPPVISNQGPLPGKGYAWRIQIPFLVTYQSENTATKRNYYVILSVVHVPTGVNKQGIGIDQFVMV